MSAMAGFLGAAAACVAATALAVLLLHRAIVELAAELCGDRRRGQFWVALGSTCMVLSGAAASTVPGAVLREPHPAPGALLHGMVWQCASGLAAVLASLLVVTAAMFAF